MNKAGKTSQFWIAVAVALLGTSLIASAQDVPKSQLPVLTTSAGQSADVETLNTLMEEAAIGYDYCDVPTADMIAAGVGLGDRETGPGFHAAVGTDLTRFSKGTPYKTVILAIGASLKGMGASGLTLEAEEARLKKLIDHCKANKIYVIAVHLGGGSKRGAPGSDNERMIDAVAPFSDCLVVTNDSDEDGRFAKISKAKNIPLTRIQYALDLVEILKKIFL